MNCFLGNSLSNQCVESILQTLAEGLFIIDTQGIIRYCNQALVKLTGKSTDEIIGQSCCSLMKELCNPPPNCSLFTKNEITNTECSILHKSGNTIPVLKNARILRDTEGKVIGAVETITDISTLKNTQNQLQKLQQSNSPRRLAASD